MEIEPLAENKVSWSASSLKIKSCIRVSLQRYAKSPSNQFPF